MAGTEQRFELLGLHLNRQLQGTTILAPPSSGRLVRVQVVSIGPRPPPSQRSWSAARPLRRTPSCGDTGIFQRVVSDDISRAKSFGCASAGANIEMSWAIDARNRDRPGRGRAKSSASYRCHSVGREMPSVTWTFSSLNENAYDCDTWPAFGDGLALRIAL